MPVTRSHVGDPDEGLPVFPGFREMAESRRRLLGELVSQRQSLGLSQTAVAARMGTSQSAVARLEAVAGDVRLSTLERYAEALGHTLRWSLEPASGPAEDPAGDAKARGR
ncbi:MAG: helix-turn-helix domain-containing protein [Acidimicrobiales bacterium]